MDDLDLLKRLPGRIDPLDDTAKDRMLTLIEAKIALTPVRRPSRAIRASALGIAAVLAAASLAAAVAIHPWSADQPVAIPVATGLIPDSTGMVSTAADLESAVAEFTPAIRLPEGGSFAQWTQHLETGSDSGLQAPMDRSQVAIDMAGVSECQWGQRWLDESEQGDQVAARQAIGVLSRVSDWIQGAGIDDGYMARLLVQMNRGDTAGIHLFESAGCSYTGSWGTTPAQQDAKATGDLSPAVSTVQAYLQRGGDAGAFDRSKAAGLAPNVYWASSDEQPAPAPSSSHLRPSQG